MLFIFLPSLPVLSCILLGDCTDFPKLTSPTTPHCSLSLYTLTYVPSSFSKDHLNYFSLKITLFFFFFAFSLSPPEPGLWSHAWTIAVSTVWSFPTLVCLPASLFSWVSHKHCLLPPSSMKAHGLTASLSPTQAVVSNCRGVGFRYSRQFIEM